MHFHQTILELLKQYRKEINNNFNFLVRQRARTNDKNYPGGKFAHGIVFQGNDDYCSVGLIDKNAGNNSTRSVGLVFKPIAEGFNVALEIIFKKEKNEKLIDFYRTLASMFDNVKWDDDRTSAVSNIGKISKDDPSKLYQWLDENYPKIRNLALETDVKNLVPSDKKFNKLQNKLEEKLEEATKPKNYWLFQGNPKVFDFKAAISEGTLDNFNVSAHKDKIQKGDKVIIWISGKQAGCYALAEVTTEPKIIQISSDDSHWKQENSNNLKAGIQITHNLYDNPILWEDIKDSPDFKNLNAGHQGTNFSATELEYKTLLEISNSKNDIDDDFSSFEVALSYFRDDELELFFQFLDELVEANNLKAGDQRTVFTCGKEYLNLNIGQRLVWRLSHKKSDHFWIITDKKFDEDYLPFDGPPEHYYTTFSEKSTIAKVKESSFRAMKKELERSTKSSYLRHANKDFERAVFDKTFRQKFLKPNEMKQTNIPLNQILFGPPGTGKTYKLQSQYFKQFTKYTDSTSKDDYLVQQMESLAWWQVLFIALLDLGKVGVKDILLHPAVRAKAKSTSISNLRASLWGTLQRHTKDECEHVNVKSRAAIKPFWKTEDSLWHLYSNDEADLFPEAQEILDKYKNYENTNGQEIKNYTFVTFHQSFTYEDFVEGIKPVLEDDNEDLRYEISDGVFKKLALKAHNDPDNNYAIFIDEINRGNVASIFGELITLIEKDKRAGAENELSVILPYSKTKFSVPSNLHIVGTMNTADRSIEALDSALRRRFEFEEVMPDYQVIDEKLNNLEFKSYKVSNILKTINERITVLINRDHQIGHSYFLNLKNESLEQDLKNVFKNKIVPLLQEYFFNDYIKIAMVIGEGFMDKDRYSNVKFATNDGDYDSDYSDMIIYEIKKDVDINEAITLLMGDQNEN